MEEILINVSISVVVILILVIPLYILSKKSSKEKVRNLWNKFDQFCMKNALQVTDKELIGNKVFGYDQVKNIMVLVFIMGDVEEEYLIDLDKSSKGTANKIESKNGGFEVKLAYVSSTSQKHEILFYRHFRDDENDLIPLLKKAESISALINKIEL
ncbi:MAG TPA: hypothetical protein VF602_01015 [Pedobacter sp.]|jgi:hypothetical protein